MIGAYGWTDDKGILRLYDYLADEHGYRVVRERSMKVADEGPSDREGQYAVNANKIARRRPASYNSIRKSNLEKVRKRSHDLKQPDLNEAIPNPLKTENGAQDLLVQTALSNPTAEILPSTGKEEDLNFQKEKQNVNNLQTNSISRHPDLAKSIDGIITTNTKEKKENPTKRGLFKNGRLMMRGKKLRLFDKEFNETQTIGDSMNHASQDDFSTPGQNYSSKIGLIIPTDNEVNDVDFKTELKPRVEFSPNYSIKLPSKRPKTSISRLLRAKQRQSKTSLNTVSPYQNNMNVRSRSNIESFESIRSPVNHSLRSRGTPNVVRNLPQATAKTGVSNQPQTANKLTRGRRFRDQTSSPGSVSPNPALAQVTNGGPELVRKKRKHSVDDTPTNTLQSELL